MEFAPGVRLGAYELLAAIGAGGMGEVYRARDTRLDRIVAIKVLPAAFAADAQLRERFDREARAISALNHPHICTLHDIGRHGDVDFLVLEHLEGQTLAQRLERGAMPPAEAARVAIEIAGALAMAHKLGVVHRDIKPANIMLTKAGAKLLDFGLAKAAAPVVAMSGLSMLPTTPPGITAQGTILGTFQYMAPEQIEGLEADARTDIFAFGAVLFEMLTGRPAFVGKTRASLLGAILKDEPPRVTSLQPVVPPALDRIVSTCLAKDPDERYQTALDLVRDLRAAVTSSTAIPTQVAIAPRGRRMAMTAAAAIALVATSVGAGAWLMMRTRPVTGTEPIQFAVPPPEKFAFGGPSGGGTGSATQLALSPDGRQLAFIAGDSEVFTLWIRSAGTLTPRVIAGSEGAAFPFWSPDGRYVAFFAANQLKKVAVSGGTPVVLCDAPNGRGGTWNRDNIILFGGVTGPLQRISAAGGIPTPASALDKSYGDQSHRWPYFLPDGRHFLYTAVIGVCCPASKPAQVRTGVLESFDAATVFQEESAVEYASGHLLYSRGGTLMAQPFDASRLRLTGDPFPVADHVNREGSRYASFSASSNGVLALAHGAFFGVSTLTWRDRTGNVVGTVGAPGFYLQMALSPDERRVAVTLPAGGGDATDRDIWIIDIQRGTTSRLTFEPGNDLFPVWSPDGTRIAFQGVRDGTVQLRQKLATGTAPDEPMSMDRGPVPTPTSWSSDGRFLLFDRGSTIAGTGVDVWALPLFGDRKPFVVIGSRFNDSAGVFSPDGRWIAYQSNETGIFDVYIQPFPPTGAKYQVSQSGGAQPLWSADGRELFFLALGAARVMAVSVDTSGAFELGTPRPLFVSNAAGAAGNTGGQYAVSRDGKRFLFNTMAQQATSEPLTITINWLAAVQK